MPAPFLTVVCASNPDCPQRGIQRTVPLRTVTEGVLDRPHLICAGCHHDLKTVTEEEPIR